jgi:hypothetical protein
MHALHEQLASNCQVAMDTHPSGFLASGSRLQGFAAACQLPEGLPLAHVHLRQALLAGAVLGQRLLRHVRPAAWRAVLDGSASLPEPDWLLSACGDFVRQGPQGSTFQVRPDGRLCSADAGVGQPAAGAWRACGVRVLVPPAEGP